MKFAGRRLAPISIRSGIPTAAAITSQIQSACGPEPSHALESLETSFHQDPERRWGHRRSYHGDCANGTQSIRLTIGRAEQLNIYIPLGRPAGGNRKTRASADKSELDVQSASDINLTKLLERCTRRTLGTRFYSTNGGQSGFGNDDNVTVTSVHISDLHASNFIIH